MEWSGWSPVDSFKVKNSIGGTPQIVTDKLVYQLADTIYVTYSNGLNVPLDWIGIYKKGEVPGGVASTTWSYTAGSSGIRKFKVSVTEEYYAAFFTADGYTEVAPRVDFYVGPIPLLSSNLTTYTLGANVVITYTTCPGFALDWIGVYKVGQIPGTDASQQYQYTSGTSGVRTFTNLPKGYYFANYYLRDGYNAPGQKIFFSVGDTITQLTINKSIYNVGEYIAATWTDSPGIVKDWFGIYDTLVNPQTGNLAIPYVSYTYFGGNAFGTKNIADTLLPQPAVSGSYFIVMFTNDSYTEVSNRCYFQIVDTTAMTTGMFLPTPEEQGIKVYPNPTKDKSFIQSNYPIDKVELLNDIGQVVFSSTNTQDKNFTLLHNDLPAGIYYLRVHTRKLYTYKLIVTR